MSDDTDDHSQRDPADPPPPDLFPAWPPSQPPKLDRDRDVLAAPLGAPASDGTEDEADPEYLWPAAPPPQQISGRDQPRTHPRRGTGSEALVYAVLGESQQPLDTAR